ncbi:hypothetical protein PO124_24835 [Bacillus licheniformis]|nr:hypothetical protein [Bacillus licheniformis]
MLGWMFMISAVSLAGVPPFSGFIGKLKLQKAAFKRRIRDYAADALSSLLVLYSVMKYLSTASGG